MMGTYLRLPKSELLYYYGLERRPYLLARSSKSPWTAKKIFDSYWKYWIMEKKLTMLNAK